MTLDASTEHLVRDQLARQIRHDGDLAERVTVRFEDVNGPKGGVDTICRIKVVLAGHTSIVVEKLDVSVGHAFARAVAAIGIAVRRARDKHAVRSH